MEKIYPCDVALGYCPFNAEGAGMCRSCCGLGVDEADTSDLPTEPDDTQEEFLDYDR